MMGKAQRSIARHPEVAVGFARKAGKKMPEHVGFQRKAK